MNFTTQTKPIIYHNQIMIIMWTYFYNIHWILALLRLVFIRDISFIKTSKNLSFWWKSKFYQTIKRRKTFLNPTNNILIVSKGGVQQLQLIQTPSFFTKNKALNQMVLRHFFRCTLYYYRWYGFFKNFYIKYFFMSDAFFSNVSKTRPPKAHINFWHRLTLLKIKMKFPKHVLLDVKRPLVVPQTNVASWQKFYYKYATQVLNPINNNNITTKATPERIS